MRIISRTLLENRVSLITDRTYAISLGRAALGLKLLLEAWKVEGKYQKIALPSFLCQSPLAAILAAGWEPVFCDIDILTANVNKSEWNRILDLGVDAILFVHLFGNTCPTKKIADKCKIEGIHFIEDIAQALGGTVEGSPCGCHGDAALVSFGHTKLINVQMGGMILLDDEELFNDLTTRTSILSLEVANKNDAAKNFTEAFYKARSRLVTDYHGARKEFSELMLSYIDLLNTSWDESKNGLINEGLDMLERRILERREKAAIYIDLLKKTDLVPIDMSEGSVPWRSVFRLDGINWREQYEISEEIRKYGIDVSNWYIPSHWMIKTGSNKRIQLRNTEKLSQEIFQFWLDEKTPLSLVKKTSKIVSMVLQRGVGYA